MKRNNELIRRIVLAIEDHPSGQAPYIEFEGYDQGEIGYHAYLLVDAGLAQGANVTTNLSPGPQYMINNLTSAGHDFAESSRNEHIWNEVKAEMQQKGVVSTTLDVLKRMLDKRLRKLLEVD